MAGKRYVRDLRICNHLLYLHLGGLQVDAELIQLQYALSDRIHNALLAKRSKPVSVEDAGGTPLQNATFLLEDSDMQIKQLTQQLSATKRELKSALEEISQLRSSPK